MQSENDILEVKGIKIEELNFADVYVQLKDNLTIF